jgi:hypothetical protein
MGDSNPPTAADYAHDTANQAINQAKANAGAFDMLLDILYAKHVLNTTEYQSIKTRTLWR